MKFPRAKHLCQNPDGCMRRATFTGPDGHTRADAQHQLCRQCFRAQIERLRVWQQREGHDFRTVQLLAGHPQTFITRVTARPFGRSPEHARLQRLLAPKGLVVRVLRSSPQCLTVWAEAVA